MTDVIQARNLLGAAVIRGNPEEIKAARATMEVAKALRAIRHSNEAGANHAQRREMAWAALDGIELEAKVDTFAEGFTWASKKTGKEVQIVSVNEYTKTVLLEDVETQLRRETKVASLLKGYVPARADAI